MTTLRSAHVASSLLPPVDLDAPDARPIYRRIADWYRKAIVSGLLRAGQRVPSTRALAQELKVSRLSVLSAYDQLVAEGYLEAFVGAGTRVAGSIPDEALTPAKVRRGMPGIRKNGDIDPRRSVPEPDTRHGPEWAWLDNIGALRVGLPAVGAFPHSIWSRLVNRHVRNPRPEAMVYTDAWGYLPFREAVAEYLRTSRAVRCEASQILVTTGSQAALQLCLRAILSPGDSVWVEEPGYFGAHFALTGATGLRVVPVPVDREGMDVAAGARLAPDARAAYITPSHQFPLGMIMSAARRMQLLNWAERSGTWIIEDDYDSEFRFEGRPIAALQGLDAHSRVIYVGTLSKSLFPSVRLGYLVIPPDLESTFRSRRIALFSSASTLYQAVMADFLREGHFARHIRRMRVLYEQRRRALVEAIDAHLPDRCEVTGAAAGLQLAVLLRAGIDDVQASVMAARMGISVMPLSPCYFGGIGRSGLILGYGSASVDAIRDAVPKLRTCL